MRIPPGVRRVFRLPDTAARRDRDLSDEVEFHLAMRAERLASSGLTADAARAEAARRFGDVDDLRDYCHSIEVAHMHRVRFREWLENIAQDLRVALRQVRQSPGFAAAAAFTLALGIGATTLVFSVVSGVLLTPLPFAHAGRIVQVWEVNHRGNPMHFAESNFLDVRQQSHSFAAIAEYEALAATVTIENQTMRVGISPVSRGFFDVFSMHAVAGRLFAPDEQTPSAPPVVVISYALWQQQFGGAARAIGSTVDAGGTKATIVGVVGPGPVFPDNTDIWLPREQQPVYPARTAHNWLVVGRLADGVSVDQARHDVSTIGKRLASEYEIGSPYMLIDATVVSLRDQIVGRIRPMLYRLFAASSLLLLIACANVANLLVARLASRQSELAVRIALGAGRGRLVQQLLVESLLLAIGGAIGGVVLAVGGIKLLAALTPANLPRAENVGVDWRVLLFALATSAATALTLGLIGAWRGASGDLRAALSQSQRTQSGGAAAERLRGALVVTQLGVTVVLLIGASLLGRSFMKLMQVDPGFHTQHLVVATLPGPEGGSPAALARRVQLFDETVRRARALPGVRGVGSAATMPLSGDGPPDGGFLILQSATEKPDFASFPALSKDSSRTGAANYEPVGPGYFETMGIPVLSGRVFADDDRSGAPHVAVINATLARSRWPNENPVGKVLEYGNMDGDLTPITIVGVVGDVKENGLAAPAQATVYIDYRQRPGQAQQLVLIMATDRPNAVIPEARGVLREIAPGMPVNVTTVERIVSRSVADRRFMLVLVGVFGAAALLLATLGVYSVVAYLVTQRGREISIRVALGASSSNILRLVLRQGVVLAIAGCAVGVVGAAVATRLLRSSLYETTTTDRTSFIGVVVLLCIVAVIASYIPARRAARIEPMDVMRSG